jgi:hypothetical protein
MLGVGRSYISRILGSLKERGIIQTRRGSMVVADLDRLRAIACKCNDCVRRHFDDVLRGVYPSEELVVDQTSAIRPAGRTSLLGQRE